MHRADLGLISRFRSEEMHDQLLSVGRIGEARRDVEAFERVKERERE